MAIDRISSIKFRDISRTSAVRKRIELVQRTISGCPRDIIFSRSLIEASNLSRQIPQEIREKEGANLCSSGDLAHFLLATRMSRFFCFDERPFLQSPAEWLGETPLGRVFFGEPPEVNLQESALYRLDSGYWHNCNIRYFGESAVFVLFDVFAMGGLNLQVFKADNEQALYKVTFDMEKEKYTVYYKQMVLNEGAELPLLDSASLSIVMLKGGGRRDSYCFLAALVPRLPSGALIMTDTAIVAPGLEELPVDCIKKRIGRDEIFKRLGANPYYGHIAFLYRVKGGSIA